jgi:bifunctional ADP-heptose synthase (sugar kinase/adenylyltransferase)
VDTRTKILTAAAAAALEPARPLLLVTGWFDILRAELARYLEEERQRTQAQTLAVVVRPLPGERLPAAARAEMAAALRVVDYVFIGGNEDLDGLLGSLQPIETIRLEEADATRVRQLIEHVHRQQSG